MTDFTDPAEVTGAVHAQLEDLTPAERVTVILDVLEAVATLSEWKPGATAAPTVYVAEFPAGSYTFTAVGSTRAKAIEAVREAFKSSDLTSEWVDDDDEYAVSAFVVDGPADMR